MSRINIENSKPPRIGTSLSAKKIDGHVEITVSIPFSTNQYMTIKETIGKYMLHNIDSLGKLKIDFSDDNNNYISSLKNVFYWNNQYACEFIENCECCNDLIISFVNLIDRIIYQSNKSTTEVFISIEECNGRNAIQVTVSEVYDKWRKLAIISFESQITLQTINKLNKIKYAK